MTPNRDLDETDDRHGTNTTEYDTIAEPSPPPTSAPTAQPTSIATPGTTLAPNASPTSEPTLESPTVSPTVSPTASPTASPTSESTSAPTAPQTSSLTSAPTVSPTSAPTSAPTSTPTITPVCYTDERGKFGDTAGPSKQRTQINYTYEIETKQGSQDGSFLIDKVESAISSKVLPEFFDSCAFREERRLGNNAGVIGFSSKPDDNLNRLGCRENPTNGNSCTSVVGACTFYGDDALDADIILSMTEDSLMYAMANDEFIHIDDSIVKISFVPYEEPQPIKTVVIDKLKTKTDNTSSGGFNMNYLAFMGAGLMCLIVLLIIRKVRSRSFENGEADLEGDEVDWNGARLERVSSKIGDGSTNSEFSNYSYTNEESYDMSSIINPSITVMQRKTIRNGTEIPMNGYRYKEYEDEEHIVM